MCAVLLAGCRIYFDPLVPDDAGGDGVVTGDTVLIDAMTDAPPPPPTQVSFVDSAASTNNTIVYAFNDMAIGAAAANRLIVVTVASNSPIDIVSVVVGPATATRAVKYPMAGPSGVSAIYYALVPIGVTANVVVTVSGGGASRCAVGLYRVMFESQSTPTAVTAATGWTGASSTDVARVGNGVGIWMGQRDNNNAAFALTLDGATPPADASGTFSSANFYWQYGSTTPATGGTSTYAANFGANSGAVIAAYFR